ncbi:PREDICTED: probable RNA-binding protein 46 [Vollenhovia emeryi]|uniref:probable RNA-binding protein 46 n=1 Tax=Vollenhovia emeryi TaxID=411798 RepID=UPI0005F58374|nr:PREDICTED: probable RNA-binding protein 46 [Vollenhovia emeryi]
MSDDGGEDLVGECRRTMRLLEMLRRTHYELVQFPAVPIVQKKTKEKEKAFCTQENGQRRLMSPEVAYGDWQRVKGAEVFLGRLPRDCYEDELMPLLEQAGRLLELRLMLDFSGSTRGYAFALYESPQIARRACELLNGHEIRPGHRIGVVKSMDNCRLFFGGVPKTKTKPEFMEELTKILDGITDIYLYPSGHDRSLNRGFIFVEFCNHRAAAMARRKLIPGKVMLWDHEIAVDWADPEPGDPVDEDVMETVTALFVRNLALNMPQQQVKEILYRCTNVPILKLKKINHFAFIHYENREAAQIAMDMMQKSDSIVEKQGWEVRWAKPIGASKILERERYIREAAANSDVQKAEIPRLKQGKKRSVKALAKTHEHDYLQQIRLLRNFVKERFDATCTLDCEQIDETRYVCDVNTLINSRLLIFSFMPDALRSFLFVALFQITIHKNEVIMFAFRGNPLASRQKAMNETSGEVYQYLADMLTNSAQQLYEQHHIESGMDVNPANGAPIVWYPE